MPESVQSQMIYMAYISQLVIVLMAMKVNLFLS